MRCSTNGCFVEAPEGYKTCEGCRKRSLARYYEKVRLLKPPKEYKARETKIRKPVETKPYQAPSMHPRARREHYRNLSQRVYAGYGGVCACCGESNPLFLTVDHVNNNGAEDRRNNGKGQTSFYYHIIRNNFPPDFQVLCFNCNCGRHRNKGTCPHQAA